MQQFFKNKSEMFLELLSPPKLWVTYSKQLARERDDQQCEFYGLADVSVQWQADVSLQWQADVSVQWQADVSVQWQADVSVQCGFHRLAQGPRL